MMVKIPQKQREKDFHLDPEHYEELTDETVYAEEYKVGKVFGVKNKSKDLSDDSYISMQSQFKFGKWKPHRGFNIHSIFHIDRLFNALRKVAKKIGWKVTDAEDIDTIRKELREKQEIILSLENRNKSVREEHELLMNKYNEQRKKLMMSRIDEFKETISNLKGKIKDSEDKGIPESELQEFLYKHTWLLGTEYISAEPQKLRGAHSKFDFYLERFNKTNDIVEIKLLSDQIINKDGSISAKVIQAVDQLIDYLESSTAAAHSRVIGDEEGMRELRPKGIVIIGKDTEQNSIDKLHKWNFQLSRIHIMTYNDVLKKAESVIKHIEKQEVAVND